MYVLYKGTPRQESFERSLVGSARHPRQVPKMTATASLILILRLAPLFIALLLQLLNSPFQALHLRIQPRVLSLQARHLMLIDDVVVTAELAISCTSRLLVELLLLLGDGGFELGDGGSELSDGVLQLCKLGCGWLCWPF